MLGSLSPRRETSDATEGCFALARRYLRQKPRALHLHGHLLAVAADAAVHLPGAFASLPNTISPGVS
jgi:hypothetical protein